jgi:uncharacterized membrane protein (DUF106 family)
MKATTERLNNTSQVLKDALKEAHEMEDQGREMLEMLDEHTEKMKHIKENVCTKYCYHLIVIVLVLFIIDCLLFLIGG